VAETLPRDLSGLLAARSRKGVGSSNRKQAR